MKHKTVFSIGVSAISGHELDEWGKLLIVPTPPGKVKVTVGRWDKDTYKVAGFRCYTAKHKRAAALIEKFRERHQ